MSASVVHVSFHSGQADVKTPETVGDFGTEIFELSVHGRDAFGYDADLMTRVFPDPAPATITRGPSPYATASRCAGFRSSKMGSMPWVGSPRIVAQAGWIPRPMWGRLTAS